jgi:hypothetical protein
MQMQQTMMDASPMVVQAITATITQPLGTIPTNQYISALRCLQAWLSFLRAEYVTSSTAILFIDPLSFSHITPLIPLLINLLDPSFPDDSVFIASSDALQELTSKSPLSDGAGSKTLTEPLMVWFNSMGNKIVENALANDDISPISHSLCKLIVALGDHSTSYIAQNISSVMPTSAGPNAPPTTKGHLTQNFLRLLLAYTGLPGYYGVDEEESEMTLGFWYLFQEALWSTNLYADDNGRPYSPAPEDKDTGGQPKQVLMAKAVFSELVQVLRRKVAFPPAGSGWSRGGVFFFAFLIPSKLIAMSIDQVEKFQV